MDREEIISATNRICDQCDSYIGNGDILLELNYGTFVKGCDIFQYEIESFRIYEDYILFEVKFLIDNGFYKKKFWAGKFFKIMR